MKRCIYCGFEADGARLCPKCNNKMAELNEVVFRNFGSPLVEVRGQDRKDSLTKPLIESVGAR